MKLGLSEIKVAIADLVKNFEIFLTPATRFDNQIAADSFLLTLDGEIKIKMQVINQ